ncbi:Maturase [Rhynchospora pubera]|uniref:Maturase n=2 Tax=Rhynchospora pubera TaxID=906938 RepID=A0AAV8AS09_9POAL|nr:Maturase [Rhynchospora pubera]
MKEAIRMVPEFIYDPEFPDTSHFRSGRGCHSALRRIKEEWGTSRWFLEFDIRKCLNTIDQDRLISILKEEIDDSKFFYSTQNLFSSGLIVRGGKGPDSVPNSVLVSALLGNIYLHKLDHEIGRIRQKHEIPLVQRIRSVLLRTGRRIEASFNAPQDNRAIIVGRVKSIQRKPTFHSLVSSWHPPPPASLLRRRGDQKNPYFFPTSASLAAFLNKPSSLLCTAFLIEAAGFTPKAEFYGRKCGLTPNLAMRDLLQYCKRRGLLIELGGKAILVIRSSEKGQLLQPAPFQSHSFLIRIFYARYADDLLLGIVGAVFILIEIKKRITHFLQSGLKGSAGSTTIAARSKVEFLGTVIREVPPRTTPRKFLRELEKRLRVKHRIHITACHLRSAIHSKFRDLGNSILIKELTKGMSGRGRLLDAVQLADTLGKEGLRSTQVSVLWGTVKHIRQGARAISLLHSSGRSKVPPDNRESPGLNVSLKELGTPAGRKAAGKGKGNWAGSFSSEFPIRIEAPIKKILRRLRDRGIISRRRPSPIHVASLTNVSDGDIVNRSAGIAISPLSYYRCCDNLYQVRTIVDYQIRWSAIKTLAHKHKSSARHIIPKYPKDLKIVKKQGCQTLAEFPNSIELGKLGPGQDSNNDLEKKLSRR